MTLALLATGLYTLGALLMGRRFRAAETPQLSDEPGPTTDVAGPSLIAALLWPLVVLALALVDLRQALPRAARR